MKNIRLLHRYMGLFFSPAILFFTFSGVLQTFNLHQQNRSTGYVPAAWVVEMAQIHKKQTSSVSKEKSKPTSPEGTLRDPVAQKVEKAAPSPRNTALPLKCFVLVMSVGLFASTLLGIYMAFRYGGKRRIVWGMLIGGTLLPIVAMFL
jgi:hypothetical protein